MTADPEPAPTVANLLMRATPTAWVTPSLAALLVIAFALSVVKGVGFLSPTAEQLLAVGGSFGPRIAFGQWWRLLSATFLHAGLIHLVMNLWVLLQGGPLAERLFGNLGFAAIYFLSGIGASLLSVTLHPDVVGVGASGAIFGVFGALLAFMITHRGVIPRELLARQRNSILAFVGYNVLYGLAQENIDMAGHAGGFLVGGVAGLLLSRDLLAPREGGRRRLIFTTLIAGGLALSAVGAKWRLDRLPDVVSNRLADRAFAAYDAQNYQSSVDLYTQALAIQPSPFPPWLRERGLAEIHLKQPRQALADWKIFLAARPMPEFSVLQCGASQDLDHATPAEMEAGIGFCTSALALHPGDADLLYARGVLLRWSNRLPEALADIDAALAVDQKRPNTWYSRYRIDSTLGNYRDAISDLDHRDALKPNEPDTLNNRAWMKVMIGDFAGARADADRSLALRAGDRSTLGTRCFALAGLKLRDAAHADCAQSVSLCHGDNCHIDAGMLALLEGRKADARSEWEAASARSSGDRRDLAPYLKRLR